MAFGCHVAGHKCKSLFSLAPQEPSSSLCREPSSSLGWEPSSSSVREPSSTSGHHLRGPSSTLNRLFAVFTYLHFIIRAEIACSKISNQVSRVLKPSTASERQRVNVFSFNNLGQYFYSYRVHKKTILYITNTSYFTTRFTANKTGFKSMSSLRNFTYYADPCFYITLIRNMLMTSLAVKYRNHLIIRYLC